MSTIDNLIEKKKQYYSLLDKVESTKKNIDDSIKHIGNGIESFQKSYVIEEESADNNILEDVQNNCVSISERLALNIENINSEIKSLDRQINQYYEDVAAAAAAAAAAARAAKQRESKQTNNSSNTKTNTNNSNKNINNNRTSRAKLRDDMLKW